MKLYVSRDKLANVCSPIFESQNDLTAIRSFKLAMKEQPFLQDYQLIAIGAIDRKSGQLTVQEPNVIYEEINE